MAFGMAFGMELGESLFDISYLAVLLTLNFAFYIPVVLNIFKHEVG